MSKSLKLPSVKAVALAYQPAEYNEIVRTAKLVSVQLSKVDFAVDEKFYDQKKRPTLSMNREYLKFLFDKKQKIVAGSFRFSIDAKTTGESILGGSADYLVIYELADGASEAAAIDFCKRVGVFAAYPYYRALVAHLSWAANTRLPPMPVIATRGALMKDPATPVPTPAPAASQVKRLGLKRKDAPGGKTEKA